MEELARIHRNRFVLLTTLAVVAALYFARDFLMPLALALLLTFLLAPLVDWFERRGLNRALAVLVVSILAFSAAALLVYVVVNQLIDLIGELPSYRHRLHQNLGHLGALLRGGVSETSEAVEQLTEELERAVPAGSEPEAIPKVQVVAPAPDAMLALRSSIAPLVQPVGTAVVVIVFVVFMLLRRADLVERLIRLMGARNLTTTTEALRDAGARVARYLLMQTAVNGGQGLCVATGLALIGVPNAPLWGALTLVLRFIPYAGPWLAASMPIALSFAVAESWIAPLLTIGLFVTVESISNLLVEPWLYGGQTGVSPVALLVAATFWTWLWGLPGLFLAIPLTVCVVVIGKYIPQLAFLNVLLGDEPALAPHERYYQRLLARSPEEADDLIESALAADGLVAVCDCIVAPALDLLEADHERGELDDAGRDYVLDRIEERAEELAESAARAPIERAESVGAGAGVLLLPVADRADAIAARLLAAALGEAGANVQVAPAGSLKSELIERALRTKPEVLVLVGIPPGVSLPARHLCKRLRSASATLPIVVAYWTASGDAERARARLEPAGANAVTTSCAESLEAVLQRLASVRSLRYRSAPSAPIGA